MERRGRKALLSRESKHSLVKVILGMGDQRPDWGEAEAVPRTQ